MKEKTIDEIILWFFIIGIFVLFCIGMGAGKTKISTIKEVKEKVIENTNNDQKYFIMFTDTTVKEVDRNVYMLYEKGDKIQINEYK